MNVVLIPSVGGGIGHISRTSTLARALCKLDPAINVEFVLDSERLRPFNIEAAMRTGFRVNFLPPRTPDNRQAVARACFAHADVIIEDTQLYLVPMRPYIPHAAWVSIPLFPMGDELFGDWPTYAQADAVIWAYAPVVGIPPELALLGDKVLHTGPFLEIDNVPKRSTALEQLGFAPDEQLVVYAPRGMPFGPEFGQQVLGGVYGAVERLREQHPRLRLVLLAVQHPDEIRAPGVPTDLPSWVKVVGTVSPAESLLYTRAAAVVVAEGTSTTHEAAALRTPLLMVPGTIRETWTLGTRLKEQHAAHILWIEQVTPASVAQVFERALVDTEERTRMLDAAHALVTGGGGAAAAARRVLDIVAARKAGGRDGQRTERSAAKSKVLADDGKGTGND